MPEDGESRISELSEGRAELRETILHLLLVSAAVAVIVAVVIAIAIANATATFKR